MDKFAKGTTFIKVLEPIIQVDFWLSLNLINILLFSNISTNKILFICRKHKSNKII